MEFLEYNLSQLLYSSKWLLYLYLHAILSSDRPLPYNIQTHIEYVYYIRFLTSIWIILYSILDECFTTKSKFFVVRQTFQQKPHNCFYYRFVKCYRLTFRWLPKVRIFFWAMVSSNWVSFFLQSSMFFEAAIQITTNFNTTVSTYGWSTSLSLLVDMKWQSRCSVDSLLFPASWPDSPILDVLFSLF